MKNKIIINILGLTAACLLILYFNYDRYNYSGSFVTYFFDTETEKMIQEQREMDVTIKYMRYTGRSEENIIELLAKNPKTQEEAYREHQKKYEIREIIDLLDIENISDVNTDDISSHEQMKIIINEVKPLVAGFQFGNKALREDAMIALKKLNIENKNLIQAVENAANNSNTLLSRDLTNITVESKQEALKLILFEILLRYHFGTMSGKLLEERVAYKVEKIFLTSQDIIEEFASCFQKKAVSSSKFNSIVNMCSDLVLKTG